MTTLRHFSFLVLSLLIISMGASQISAQQIKPQANIVAEQAYNGVLESIEIHKHIERSANTDETKRSLPQSKAFLYGFKAMQVLTGLGAAAIFSGISVFAGHHFIVNSLLPAIQDPSILATAVLLKDVGLNAAGAYIGMIATVFGYDITSLATQAGAIIIFAKNKEYQIAPNEKRQL